MADQSSANLDAQLATEWFNGRGAPIGLERENIPLSAQSSPSRTRGPA
jgi:hypothetical protein